MAVVVSIICTNYNKGAWIGEALESFLQQETSFSYEIIIVDDASTDHSPEIIREYVDKYPQKIRFLENPENLGIAKTWVKACQHAKGQYIARCDGDDFWTDPKKLEKQVQLLKENPDSRWSNTDFDMVYEEGNLLQKDVLQNAIIPFMDSYEKQLALKGMTMSSTWLVDRQLMLEVNEELDLSAADDTFNLQLELFQRTKLSFLPESTTIYRMASESDSRTLNIDKLKTRFEKLLQTQLTYLDKYPSAHFEETTRLLMTLNTQYELQLARLSSDLGELNGQSVTIYFADANGEFAEQQAYHNVLKKEDHIRFEIPEDCATIRVDLSEVSSYYQSVHLVDDEYDTELLPQGTTAIVIDGGYYFVEDDPQIYYAVEKYQGKMLRLSYQVANVVHSNQSDYLLRQIVASLAETQASYNELLRENYSQEKELEHVTKELHAVRDAYNRVVASRRWRYPSKIINHLRRPK